MTEEITKAEEMKNDFIASVSHELRTPLTSIKGWAITLESGELDNKEEMKEGLKIIEDETERLSGLVEELLDFSRLSGGKMKLKCEICDLEPLLKQIANQMKPRAIRQNIRLICDINKLSQIKIDKNRIRQVIINIIDNSFKFTPQNGEIKISAFEENKKVIIKISDSGIGIKEEDKEKVMKKFYKGDSKYSGSGLGLAICKEIIMLHGGSISLKSEEGKGTEIKIVFDVTIS
jgi:signal transduction histidine kinase